MELLNTLGVNWGVLTAQLINFGILLTALTFLLYKPILKLLDDRRERVRISMEHAAKLEQQVAEMEKDRKLRMQEIDNQAKAFLEESRKQAESAHKQILDGAKIEVEMMLKKGRSQLEDERRRLMADLQKTVTAASVALASKVIGREFSSSDQQRLLKTLEQEVPSLIQ